MSVPSLARLRRLLEAGCSTEVSWGLLRSSLCVRNPCQKIEHSEELFPLKFVAQTGFEPVTFQLTSMHASSVPRIQMKNEGLLSLNLLLFTHTSYTLSTCAPLSYTLSGKSIRYTSTSVPSLARLRRLLEAGNSARYLRTSWGRHRVRNPCQKIARSEDYKSSKIFICKLQYPPEHSWNKVSGNIIRKICMAEFLLDFSYLIWNICLFYYQIFT